MTAADHMWMRRVHRAGGPIALSCVCALTALFLPGQGQAQELRGAQPLAPQTAAAPVGDNLNPPEPQAETTAPDAPNALLTPETAETDQNVPDAEAPVATAVFQPETPVPRTARRRRVTEEDPYAPLGLRVGQFIVQPSVDQSVGYDSNPRNEPGGAGSAYSRSVARVNLQSNWLRHELRGTAQAGYTAYKSASDLDAPDLAADIAARVDARRDLRLDLAARAALESESPGDPELPDGISGRPTIVRFGGTVGATYKPGRPSATIAALADRYVYEDAELNNGGTLDNSDRTYTAYELRLRTGYELSTTLEPFIETSVNTRRHDESIDDLGIRRGSDGYEVAVGTRFEPSELFTMEAKVGYRQQRPDETTLPDIDGLVADGSLIWRPSALTTVTLNADTSVSETTLQGSSGALVRTVGARVDHALRRNLLLTGSLLFTRSDYAGLDYRIDETNAELGLEYRLTRTLAVHGRVAHEDYRTTIPGEDYTANIVEAGVRLSR
jgi:hypothetical protein